MQQRILYVNHTGTVSGAERILLHMLDVLDRNRYEPVVMCPAEGALASLAEARGVDTVCIPALQARFTANPFTLAKYLRSLATTILSMRREIRALAPQGIHANTVRAGIAATLATIGSRTPVLWHVQDDLPRHPLSSAIRMLAFLSRRTQIIGVSRATTARFRGALPFGTRTEVLYNTVDLSRFTLRSECEPWLKRELGLRDNDFLCCAIGQITPRKGLKGLISALHRIAADAPHIHLAIVGSPLFNRDAAYRDALIAQVKRLGLADRVHFTGERSDVAAVLRATDLLVHNANQEPFGLVLVEAMATGTPVLATRVGGIPEIVEHDHTGTLVPAKDSVALAATLRALAIDPERVAAYIRPAHEFVHAHFSLTNFRDALHTRYTHVFGTRRVAIFHDNFAQTGGAERVAEILHRTYPQSDLLTTLSVPERLSPYMQRVRLKTTWMQWLPEKAKFFRGYFLLYPFAVEQANMNTYDLVLSSCVGYAKGVKRRAGAVHICYCHTPMRWVHRTEDYLEREPFSRWVRTLLLLLLKPLKAWEKRAAKQPDYYIANSRIVAERLQSAFGIASVVIPPPIDISRFAISPAVDDFYLVLARLVAYKRIDLAIEACMRTGRKLVIIGDGPDRARLEAMADANITFLGCVADGVVSDYASRCRALICPGEEDFGMTPLEINAAGRPVVAYYGGGAMETIQDGLNGIFFDKPTSGSLRGALHRFEKMTWDPQAIRRHAAAYDVTIFQSRIREFIDKVTGIPHKKRAKAAPTREQKIAQGIAARQAAR
ncbi:MAG TPA: glycosyltransferase [Acidobacteriaceae bacterium]|nr:glycosyltransferase [Acidobacteriaceae bacterium]